MIFDLADSSFAHCAYSNNPTPPLQEPKELRWNRDLSNPKSDAIFITDHAIPQLAGLQGRRKIAWLLEPMEINSGLYQWVRQNHANFFAVMSHDIEYFSDLPNYLWVPFGGCWIPKDQWGYSGDRSGVSIVASEKRMTLGHCLRHQIIQSAKSQGLDLKCYGRAYRRVEHKIETMDRGFQVVIENASRNGYFTEKLIDCLVTGTVPIYWGCPNLEEYGFDEKGIVRVSNELEAIEAIRRCSEAEPVDFAASITNNMNAARKFILAEDYIHEHYLELLSK